jgi:hypothetical protein
MHFHFARPIDAFKRHNCAGEFHAVVGGFGFAAGKFLARAVVARMAPQPPGPGFPTCAIRVNNNLFAVMRRLLRRRNSRGNLKDTFSSRSTTFSTVTS